MTIEESNVQINKVPSAAVATAAAMLFTSGLAGVSVAADADTPKVHCTGVNSCKGTTECKSATKSCKGKNSCKGQGWVSLSQSECDAALGGATFAEICGAMTRWDHESLRWNTTKLYVVVSH